MPSSDPELTSDEFNKCGEAFNQFVLQNGFGKIDSLWKLRNVLQALGQCPTDQEMEHYFPEGGKAHLEFDDFIKIMELEKGKFEQPPPPDADAIEAFVAMGGEVGADGYPGGEVHTEHLRNLVCNFDLRLDIEKLISEVDRDGSGEIDYEEFSEMFRNMTGAIRRSRGSSELGGAAGTARGARRRSRGSRGSRATRDGMRTSLMDGVKGRDRRDSDATSEGSDAGHRAVKTLTYLTERKPLALVIASGAKKTSEKRELTRDEMVAIRLRRVENNIKRRGMIGGEVPPVTSPVPLPAKVRRQLAMIRNAPDKRKGLSQEKSGAGHAVGYVCPGKRGRDRIPLNLRLPDVSGTPLSSPSASPSDLFGSTVGSGVFPPEMHFQHRPEAVSTSLQAQVRGIQRTLKRQRESTSPRRGGTPLSFTLTNHSPPETPMFDRPANNFAISTLRNAMKFDVPKGVLLQPLLDNIPNSDERVVQFLTSAPPTQPNQLVRKLCAANTITSPITRSPLAAATTTIYKKSAHGGLAKARSPFAQSPPSLKSPGKPNAAA